MSARSLFPHQQLSWYERNLEQELKNSKDRLAVLKQLALLHLSKGLFHDGGEAECAKAFSYTQKALREDPTSSISMAISGLALMGMERPKRAEKYLYQARELNEENAILQIGLGQLEQFYGDIPQLLKHFERACQIASESWETNFLFGRSLLGFGIQNGDRTSIDRALYHLIRTKDLKQKFPDEKSHT